MPLETAPSSRSTPPSRRARAAAAAAFVADQPRIAVLWAAGRVARVLLLAPVYLLWAACDFGGLGTQRLLLTARAAADRAFPPAPPWRPDLVYPTVSVRCLAASLGVGED